LLLLLSVLIPAAIIMLFVADNFPARSNNQASNPYSIISYQNKELFSNTQKLPVSSKNIEVITPFSNETVKSGFIVKGNARTLENAVYFRLYDSTGNVLTETYTNANAPSSGQFGPFEKLINFDSEDSSGLLEIFQYSYSDGSQIDKVTIPLVFTR
jgi:hypothetical protein